MGGRKGGEGEGRGKGEERGEEGRPEDEAIMTLVHCMCTHWKLSSWGYPLTRKRMTYTTRAFTHCSDGLYLHLLRAEQE